MKYQAYPEYKDSGAEWLEEVPSHWKLLPFWTLYKRTKRIGFDDEQLLSVYRDYGVIIKSSRDDNFNKESEDLSSYQLVTPGDLAMNKMKAWQGSLGVSEHQGIVSPAYFVFQSQHNEYDKYLHYLLRSPRYITGYLSFSKGIRVNQWDLDPQYHSRMPVTIPPYEEQKIIANFIDRETQKIDNLISKQQNLIELLKEKRQAVISHAVTKGINPDVKMKDSGVEWLGEIPEHWETIKFSHEVKIAEGQVDPTKQPYSSMILFGPEHVESGTGKILNQVTAEDQSAISGKYYCNAGDIIYSKIRPALRKVVIAPSNCLCSADMYPMTASKKFINTYIYWFFLSEQFFGWSVLESDRVAMPKINRITLSSLKIPAPPIDEQEAIFDHLNYHTNKIDALLYKAIHAIPLLQERRTALISAAVTGKIDVRTA